MEGDSRREAEALRRLGYSVDHHCGSWQSAVELLGRSLALLRAPDRDRAIALTYYGEVLETIGRREEADSTIREAAAIAERLGDARAIFVAAWTAALFAAHRGDREELDAQVARAEEASGRGVAEGDANLFEFQVTIADALAGLGDTDAARSWLERARPFAQAVDRTSAVRMVEARIEAVGGDPGRAIALLDEIEGVPRAVPQQLWIRRLERAVAEWRRGDVERARAATADAFRLADDQGLPDLPQRIEPWMVGVLSEVLPAAVATPATRVSLLGRFAVTGPTGDRTPPPGQLRALLAMVAWRGTVPVEEAIDQLWPEVDAATGRSRLRNSLNRLRERAGPLVERDGELLVLSANVDVDAVVFERLADAALRADADERVGLARHALSHYAGEPLAEHRYESWAAGPRERLRRRHVSLLDLVIDDARAAGDLDDAIRHLESAVEAEPLDESRHLQLVEALVRQGRRAVARVAVEHAVAALRSIGDDPGPELASWWQDLVP